MCTTKVISGNDILAMHSYLVDSESRQAVLYTSSSAFRTESDGQKRNFIGRANRWLHYQDILLFKSRGLVFLDLDFGGYAKVSPNVELQRINQFKEGFGGTLVEQSNYISGPVICKRAVGKFVLALRARTIRKHCDAS